MSHQRTILSGCYSYSKSSYPQLSGSQLRAALAYYALYPDEINARLAREESWTPEEVWSRYPFTRPGSI